MFFTVAIGAGCLGLAHAIIPSWRFERVGQPFTGNRWVLNDSLVRSSRTFLYVVAVILILGTIFNLFFTLGVLWYPLVSGIYPRYLI